MIINSALGLTPTSPVAPVTMLNAAVSAAGQKQYDEMVYSRDVEKEDNHDLVHRERQFARELTQKLDTLNSTNVLKLVEAISTLDFKNNPILLEPDLPYLVMEALRRGLLDPEHGKKQAATALNFWAALQYHQKDPRQLQTIELFEVNGSINPLAEALIKQTLKGADSLQPPYLDGRQWDVFIENMRKLPPSEQRFLLVPDIQGNQTLEQAARENGGNFFKATTSQAIGTAGINVFNRVDHLDRPMRMVPSLGMMQAFLDAQFDEPVQINPRIYLSTVAQIRECGCTSCRDMMMPFPDASGHSRCLPKADGFEAPWYDFPYHDFYHAIIASSIGKVCRKAGIIASDVISFYADEPTTENRKGLKQLAISLVDMEYIQFHRKKGWEIFKKAMEAQVARLQVSYRTYLKFQLEGLPFPYEVFPISKKNEREVLVRIQEHVKASFNDYKPSSLPMPIQAIQGEGDSFHIIDEKHLLEILQQCLTAANPIGMYHTVKKTFLTAAKMGCLSVVQEVLKNKTVYFPDQYFNKLYSPVIKSAVISAAETGHLSVIQALLEADPIGRESLRFLAVETAAAYRHLDVVQGLLDNVARIPEASPKELSRALGENPIKLYSEFYRF